MWVLQLTWFIYFQIISEYEHNRSVFLSDVFKNSKHLEDITGLTKLYQDTEQAEADVWDFEPQDEDWRD